MSNSNGFDNNANIFSSENALNQNIANGILAAELEVGSDLKDSAEFSPKVAEQIELTTVEQRSLSRFASLFPTEPTAMRAKHVESEDFDGDPLLPLMTRVSDIAINSVMVKSGSDNFANFEVTLDKPEPIPITVDFTADNGKASSESDFTSFNGSITFEPGETSKTVVSILINDDSLDEVDEFFSVRLDNPVNAEILNNESTATIGDNDKPPELSIADAEVAEGDDGETLASFTVSLDAPSSKEISVDYATSDDRATAGSDYRLATGTLTFNPGETSKTIEVAVSGDTEPEADEAFDLILSNPNNATLLTEASTATGTIINDDSAQAVLSLGLYEDTGADGSDNISTNATITGSVDNFGDDVVLSASLNDSEPREFEDLVQSDGSFTLELEQLRTINGGDLTDGSYTLQLTATNPQTGDTQSQSLTFVLDTTAPDLNLITPLADGDHSSRSRLTGTIESANLASLSYSLDGGQSKAVVVDETNSFDAALNGNNLTTGTHTLDAVATDVAGNQSTTLLSFEVGNSFKTPNGTTGWGALNEDTVILGEQDSYVTQTAVPIELGLETNEDGELVGTRTISFDLDAVWGDADPDLGEDQLQVYLMDAANPSQTLLDNGESGTPLFSVAGEQSDFTPGLVSFDGTTVTIDASSLSEVTAGTLVFQLLNSDDDTDSVVAVNNLTLTTDPTGKVNPVFPETNRPIAPGGELNLDNYSVASDVSAIVNQVRFNPATGEYRAVISVANNGETELSRNTAIVFNNLPDGVELSSASGTDESGNPYLNLRPAILPGGLDMGGISESVAIVFTNPNLIRFGLDTTILTGSPNAAPVFEPIGNLTVTPGEKLELDLAATDPDGDNVTYRLDANDDLPTGMLDGSGTLKLNPAPDEIGSYEFSIIATDGAESVSQTVTLDVVADPITTTRISGVIENVEQQPLAGVVIELGDLTTVTNEDGSFTIETDQPLTDDTLKVRGESIESDQVYPFIAEKLPLVLGTDVYEGFHNYIDRPIYLPALDVASGQVIDKDVDATVTTENIPGASVFVEAGSLSTQDGEDFTGTLSITEVPTDLTPAALPENLSPDMVVTIQPGSMSFNTPAPLSLPNRAGWAASMEMDLWSINPETGDFDKVGTGRVSDDGSVVETTEGGIRNSSWHFFAPPPASDPPGDDSPPPPCDECPEKKGWKSEVELGSGAVIEDYDLVTYASNGESRGISLTYDSLRADPRPILQFGFENIASDYTRNFAFNSRLIASLSINKDGFDYQIPGNNNTELPGVGFGKHFWSLPTGAKDVSAALQADLKDFASGKYDYTLTNGIYLYAGNQIFGSSNDFEGQLFHVNSIDSAFGSGWGIDGWQEIVVSSDGSVLLIDGDGGEYWFEATVTGKQTNYSSPHGDYSTLEKLSNGTFRRTMKDKTVYDFNLNNQLASVTDSQSNQTNYIYNEQQQLITIVDPVGLSTNIFYNEAGKASLIIDPALRETSLEYDEAGNLINITNPDQSSSSWSYDSEHHMIGEIDANGNQASANYDQFGRATEATQKDGSVVLVNPTQTFALYPTEETTSAEFAPQALIRDETPTSTYANANGNVTKSELDFSGQKLTSIDGNGGNGQVLRNGNNLVVTQTDARGNNTFYSYDERGNVVKVRDFFSNSESEVGLLFDTPVLTAGRGVSDTASGDLNNDGIDDLVTANYLDRSVSVLISQGSGTFKPAVDYFINTIERPSLVRLGDFDNDGNLDIFSNQVLRGNGSGTFELWNTNSIGGVDAVLDDFNSDGFLDYASIGTNTFSVRLGNGSGTFALSGSYLDGISNDFQKAITSGDIDNDGIDDLVVGGKANQQASVYLGQGDGTFDFQSALNLEVQADSIKLGDFNQDGNLDLAVAGISPSSQVSILLGGGDGSFIPGYGYDLSIGANSLLIADFDENSILDLAIAGGSGNHDYITILTGSGDGTFSFLEEYPTVIDGDSLSTGDFNSDGIIDLATVSFAIGVPVIYGNGNGTFALGNNFDTDQVIEDATLGDLDRDGLLDLITVNRTEGLISVSKGQGSSTFGEAEDYSISTGLAHNSVETGDFNGDGFKDVVTGDAFGSFSILLGTEDGTLSEKTTYELDSKPQSILVEDLNQDGLLDLLTIGSQNDISVMLGLGDGTFEPEMKYPVGNLQISSATLGDLDQDGNLDLIALGRSGTYVLEGQGDGSFADAVAVETYTSSSSSTRGEFNAVADLNNDTFLDLVISREGTISVFLGNGDATFASVSEYKLSNSTNPKSIAVGDLDGLGELDIIYAGNSHNFGVLSGKGDGTFVPGGSYLTNGSPKGLLLADLDNDEDLDVINFDGSNKIGVRANFLNGNSNDSVATQTYTYDPTFNQVTSETDELGRQTLYDIDPNNGNLLATTFVVGEVGGDDDVTNSYTYTDAGLIETMTDPKGRVTDYDYDEFGRLIKETYAFGTADEASISYEYDRAGNQTATVDENGNRTEFEYDSLNRLIKSTYAVDTPDEAVETTEYDRNGNQIATVDGLGNRTEYKYDEFDRLIETIAPDPDGNGVLTNPVTTSTYDGVGNLIATTDPLGRETRYVYDSRNRLVKTILPDGTTTESKYDTDNNIIASSDATGEATNKIFDSRNRLIRETDAQGNITRYQYDAADQLIAIIDGNDNRTEYQYDELGRQISVTDGFGNVNRTEYDKVGNVVATVDGNGNRTEYEFDERDRNTQVTDAEGGTTTTEYDDVGNVISITDPLDRTTTYQYDGRNRQTEITDPLSHTTSYEYDDLSNVTQVTDANNHSTSFTFDGLNRQTVTTNELGDTTTNTYNAIGNLIATTDELRRTTTYTYDELNRQIAVTDPNGNTTRSSYDERGNVTATVEANGERTEVQYDELNRQIATVDANGKTTSYEYDAIGNLASITDPEGNVTSYAYDQANRRISDTNQLGDSRTYEYDPAGNLIKTTDRNGRVKTYSFDQLNRSTTEVWLDENNNPIRTFNYSYDKANQLISVNDSDSAYAYVYDLNGRLIEVDNAGTPSVPNVVFNYDYDPVGNLLSVTDTIDGKVKGTEAFTHDELNRVTRITQSGNDVTDKRVDISYDQASQMTSMSRYSDLAGTDLVAQSNYTYDKFGRLTDLAHESQTDILANYNWVYDQTNRLTQYNSPEGTANYTYDDIDQITAADYDYQEDESYTYDDNGNRTNDGYVTGENNQLFSDGIYNYEYDNEGNRVRRTEIATGIVTEYEWDYRNRLTAVVTFDSDGNVISDSDYTYDAFDKRIAKFVDESGDGAGVAVVERYVLDGEHIALTFDGEGNLIERFLHGTEVDQIIAQENEGGEVLWALADHQGSVKVLLDNDGNAVNNITYDAFGGVTIETNSDLNFRFGYTGRENDDETGLDYYGARYRDASVGRFISQDPIEFTAGDINLYRYTFNSPLNYTDPDGNAAAALGLLAAPPVAIAVVVVVAGGYVALKLLEQPKTDTTGQLRDRPVWRPQPKPEPEEEPKAPYVPNPNEECEDKKETCAKKYPQYDVLTDYIGSQFPFGGFKYDSPSQASNGIQFNRQRHSRIRDPRDVTLGNSAPMDKIFKDPQIKFLENLKDPENSGVHYNVFIKGVQPNQSAGSIGKYKFCKEGNPPKIVPASIILNIKDESGTKYYQRG